MTTARPIPSVSLTTARTGASTKANEMGMRVMQERAYARRGEQYLLIKSPPASGKSRALMFIALDKLHNQDLKQAIIVVPEKSIGGSFADEPLSHFGFWADWRVKPQWNLCNAPGIDEARVAKSKVKAVGEFLASDDRVLVCTHATFRFAVEDLGVEAFDDRLIAVDEFHHVSANPDNVLGRQLGDLIARDKAHIVAMTGSYFRGDAEAVLSPGDEAKFETVTYTYYEQLNGYEHLKALDIGYFFYSGRYLDAIMKVLDPSRKTIVHIPHVASRESTKDKIKEIDEIMDALGDWKGVDPVTGFHQIEIEGGRIIKVADLVDDDPGKRERVITALKDPAHRNDRDHVDIILALGMAKEGFDWIWCEHALTVGYRSSLTEIIQIIGRATRDAPGKERAAFTNLIAEPDAAESVVVDAINDTLKAIAASLLMEQVLAPRFEFTPKDTGPKEGFNYGEGGYQEGKRNVGVNEETGQFHFEIKGLVTPESPEATRICREDLNEVITAFVQDKQALERGLFDHENVVPEELTQLRMGKIVRDRYPELSETDQEAIRQHAVAALNLTQEAKRLATGGTSDSDPKANTALLDGVRKLAMDVRELDIDLIDRINPFEAAYAVLAKSMSEGMLKQVAAAIAAKKISLTIEEARDLAKRALKFKQEHGRLPEITSQDPWEKRMAEGVAFLARSRAQAGNG
ncbi:MULTISPECIES: pseudomurein-binding repeat-containing protein [unclassified Brevundimonas]|uniref:pseudomurein-binding repeat-containing protein n=1 Tax=unclassified Brevundimonas TaxID=2622653 RepID=UPI000CFBF53B|nr:MULTISPECIES: pseudomurein-binding repeat-containing protein [unclassified Brevundimonas]PRA28989.1 DEAD/DEAH box helicase [Brevundimonas sp. MYb27]PQZ84687.1 DEAD/DEAH box helicase [Brevundimonas sp. MYb31]PRB12460.1 DEAD/DEAH box helicase [Brevundimonas sp. MYb52]PRB32923.1 DEAD/DEAH box helicase [Brevundimonas sp. MYb46]PRB50307.1 DEAD/DEAH box helicase [Brevundimonas sp. MYb33]